jgi:hypothetical protein
VIRTFVFICFALLLQGCSVNRLAYNNADVFLRWQANSYFDFEGEESEALDQRIASLLAWHRAKALPHYARLTEEAAVRLLRGIKREDLDWGYDAFRAQVQEAVGAAAGEAAGLLDRLRPEQLAHLERRLAEENRKFEREQLRGTVEERRKRRVKRNLDRLEEWFGPLTDVQADRVRRYRDLAPLSSDLRDRDRKRRQAEFVAILRAREAGQKLKPWALAWATDREPAYAAAQRQVHERYVELLLDLDRTLSPEQREKAAARMRDYAETFSSLSRR